VIDRRRLGAVTALGRRAIAAMALACAAAAPAHGPLQEQIDALTAQIERDPSATAYLRRGELHRLHEDWDAALADYQRAAALMPADDSVDFLRGRALLEAGKPAEAMLALDRYLARHPDHVEALVTQARTLRALGHYRAAAAEYTRAIERLPRPDPDHYLERARIEAADRAGCLRLLRYCARPPFALDRLRELDPEHLLYDLPKAGPAAVPRSA
jgi:tetratricopeptide (TPR) repeat protein